MKFLLALLLLLLSLLHNPHPTTAAPPSNATTPPSQQQLDPAQIKALQSLGIPTLNDPCTNPSKYHNATCTPGKHFKHLTYLKLMSCPSDIKITTTILTSLSTLNFLEFTDCRIPSPSSFPPLLQSNLISFTSINSLKKLMGFNLGKMINLTSLSITSVPIITDAGPVVIFTNLNNLQSATLTNTNLTGQLPTEWHSTLTYLDLSHNNLKGRIPTTLPSNLQKLTTLDLSSNNLSSTLPSTLGNLIFLKTLSLSSNTLYGPIPDAITSLPSLITLNLSSNQLNGTIPKLLSNIHTLKYLNLANNNFRGILPFNESFIKTLDVFKVNDNINLCYNKTLISSNLKLGISPCDKNGLPVSTTTTPSSNADSPNSSENDYGDGDKQDGKSSGKNGPNKAVIGVTVGLSALLLLIIFLIFLAKCCA